MTTAREIMTSGAECVGTDQTAADAARLMRELRTGAVPICGPANKLKGIVTDRDVTIKVVAQGRDAGTFPAGDLNQEQAITVGADDSADEVLTTMTQHKVRRLPVIDGDRLVGMISIADVARSLPNAATGQLIAALSAE